MTNDEIIRMKVEIDVLGCVAEKRLMWYGHLRRAGNDRRTARATNWSPLGSVKEGGFEGRGGEVNEAMQRRFLETGDGNEKTMERRKVATAVEIIMYICIHSPPYCAHQMYYLLF